MARRKKEYPDPGENTSKRRHAPARTVEGVENQMIALAMDLARKQLENGTASSQTINHFLVLGTEKAKLERAKLDAEIAEKKAKAEAYEGSKRTEELYAKAIEAMKSYQGIDEDYPEDLVD